MPKVRWALWIAGLLVVLVLAYIGMKAAAVDANLITALITAVAAAFAGWSAYGSSRAARESSQTARDAVRALSLTSKPQPSFRLGGRLDGGLANVTVLNYAPHPITRGTLRWKLSDGSQGSTQIDPIPGAGITTALQIENAPRPARIIELDPAPQNVDLITEIGLDYWGANGPIGWRQTAQYTDGRRTRIIDDDVEI